MQYSTVEIDGRAVAAFRTGDRDDAVEIMESEYFQADLTILTDFDDKPLWDGKAALNLRKATTDEQRSLEGIWSRDEYPMKNFDKEYIAFLIPIKDPTDAAEEAA